MTEAEYLMVIAQLELCNGRQANMLLRAFDADGIKKAIVDGLAADKNLMTGDGIFTSAADNVIEYIKGTG